MQPEHKRHELWRKILCPLPRQPLIDLGAGPCDFAHIAHEMGFPTTALDGRTERVPPELPFLFLHCDVRDAHLEPYSIVACLGLLYHLPLDEQCALLAKSRGKIMIVETHEADPTWCTDPTIIRVGPYEGQFYSEPPGLESSIGNKRSYWHTRASLQRLFIDHGFQAAPIGYAVVPTRWFWLLKSD